MERALVELAQRGDEEAFVSLIRMSGDRLLVVASRILRDVDLAEDAVQQTIVSAWRELPTLRDPDRFAGWLYRMLVNTCYTEAKRARRWNTTRVAVIPDHAAQRDELLSVDDRDQLERAFRRLSPEQRAVFVLHHHLGMRQAEIAETLGVPIGTIKSRLHYASVTLRGAVEADARTTPSTTPGERLA